MKKSIDEGDAGGIVANSLAIAGGAALTGAGIIGTAQLVRHRAGLVAAAAAPLFLVGAVLAFGGFMVTLIVAAIKRHNQLQDASEDQSAVVPRPGPRRPGRARLGQQPRVPALRLVHLRQRQHRPEQSYFEFQRPSGSTSADTRRAQARRSTDSTAACMSTPT